MSQLVAVATLRTGAEMVARYAEARRRLLRPATPVKKPTQLKPEATALQPVDLSSPPCGKDGQPVDSVGFGAAPEIAAAVQYIPAHKRIIRRIAKEFDVPVSEILGRSRRREITTPRNAAIYACLTETSLSLPQIGRAFGGRDHTTIIHSARVHCRLTGAPLPRSLTAGADMEARRERARANYWRTRA